MVVTSKSKAPQKEKGSGGPVPVDEADLRMAKALAHTLRVQILAILDQRVASPSEMAKELGVPVSKLSYHVNELKRYDCIELEKTAQRRGAIEHYYRPNMRPYFNDEAWEKLPRSARQGISSAVLQMIFDDSIESLEEGLFDARGDRHLSRTPLTLDEKGWSEMNDLINTTLEQALDIQSKAAERMEREDTTGINTKLGIMHFESKAT